ncbi:hypothetical protein [Taibaiella soli]|uniref:Uncharacterized protein n=1 Tax=Taibaiella soli TaxID=1649169 RepID=A0A2W2AQV0_9BACT|nr:hypothetical protein [Taibaiella soli]PZF74790.1 hypothetical protein DN068_00920 [Taibaiella soli]
MSQNKYSNNNWVRYIWICLAVFFLVFNSTPVKKLIRIYVYGAPAAVTTDIESVANKVYKDCCSLQDRHEVNSEKQITAAHQDSTDPLWLFAGAAAVVALLSAFYNRRQPQFQYRYLPANKGTAPVYLQVRKLQV